MNVEIWDNEKSRYIGVANIQYIFVYTAYFKLITFNGIETKYETNKYHLGYIKHIDRGNKCQNHG